MPMWGSWCTIPAVTDIRADQTSRPTYIELSTFWSGCLDAGDRNESCWTDRVGHRRRQWHRGGLCPEAGGGGSARYRRGSRCRRGWGPRRADRRGAMGGRPGGNGSARPDAGHRRHPGEQRVMLRESAIKRLIEPEEVAEMALFLCGPAASFATGTSFVMDGGWTARLSGDRSDDSGHGRRIEYQRVVVHVRHQPRPQHRRPLLPVLDQLRRLQAGRLAEQP